MNRKLKIINIAILLYFFIITPVNAATKTNNTIENILTKNYLLPGFIVGVVAGGTIAALVIFLLIIKSKETIELTPAKYNIVKESTKIVDTDDTFLDSHTIRHKINIVDEIYNYYVYCKQNKNKEKSIHK